MADNKAKFQFDVWLKQANTVYQGVPYEVVTTWLQQGRLHGDDHIRPAGTQQWFVLAEVPAFAGFIPVDEPLRTDAAAEALEPVENPFAWKKDDSGEDAEVDMIPLIDVSLVLLIFFMMTSTVASAVSKIRVPGAKSELQLSSNVKMIWVGINHVGDDQPPKYQLRINTEEVHSNNSDMNEEQTIRKIDEILKNASKVPEIRIAAHKQLSFDLIRRLATELEKHKNSGKVTFIKIEVGEEK